MSKLDEALLRFRELGLGRDQVCITGSAGLAIWDSIGRERGYKSLLASDRVIGDVDIFTGRLGHVFSNVVHNANLAAWHESGADECVTFDIEDSRYDLSCKWPFLVANSDDVLSVSEEIYGIRVMSIGRIADCKRLFDREKDKADLYTIDAALGFRR